MVETLWPIKGLGVNREKTLFLVRKNILGVVCNNLFFVRVDKCLLIILVLFLIQNDTLLISYGLLKV